MRKYPREIADKYRIVYKWKMQEERFLFLCDAIDVWPISENKRRWRQAVKNAKETGRKIACEFVCQDTGNVFLIEVEPIVEDCVVLWHKLDGRGASPRIICQRKSKYTDWKRSHYERKLINLA